MQISIVTGTYNRLLLLKRMVASAHESAGDLTHEIVIVDGGSTDGTLEWVREQPGLVLIEHGELRGAIAAYNDGYAKACGEFVVTGNDDVTFDGDTLTQAHAHLLQNPQVGMVAFGQKYQKRGQPEKPIVSGVFGYTYGQCNMCRRWLGDLAGWWGDEGMKTYGGDTRLSLRLWEMGWPTVAVSGCTVTDYEHQDELREINSDSPWKAARGRGEPHPDLITFNRHWSGRLPKRGEWIDAPVERVLEKAANDTLRTLRFKGMMNARHRPRMALVNEFRRYGAAGLVNQTAMYQQHGPGGFQTEAEKLIAQFKPDLVILQAQRPNNFTPETVRRLRQKWPWVFWLNWDGDTHPNMLPFHAEIAKAVNLQCVVSPSLFPWYAARGVGVAYWPIGIEREYVCQRQETSGPDVVFLGALYGIGKFPEAEFRRQAVVALAHQDALTFGLHGNGWGQENIKATPTSEQHGANAALYASAKMGLSVSQSAELWGYSSDRLYNITATGCPALVQRFAGMEAHGYVDGETCIAFSTIDEMIDKAHYYARHDDERERIGAAGQVMTLERHTWAARVRGLWDILGGLL